MARPTGSGGRGDRPFDVNLLALETEAEPLIKLWKQKGLEEIVVNGPGRARLFFNDGRRVWVDVPALTFDYFKTLAGIIANVAGMKFEVDGPGLGATLEPWGHRFHAVIGYSVVARSGLSVTIRLKTLRDATFAHFGVTPAQEALIRYAIENGHGILISGGTASGKTTFLNLLLKLIPADRRLVSIQDVDELEPPHEDHVRLIGTRRKIPGKVSMADHIDNLIRERPDVPIVGELAQETAPALIRIMGTGHDNFFATLHSNDPLGSLAAFQENMILSGVGMDAARAGVRALIRNVKLIVQIKHMGESRQVTDVVWPKALPWWTLTGDNENATLGDDPADAFYREHASVSLRG